MHTLIEATYRASLQAPSAVETKANGLKSLLEGDCSPADAEANLVTLELARPTTPIALCVASAFTCPTESNAAKGEGEAVASPSTLGIFLIVCALWLATFFSSALGPLELTRLSPAFIAPLQSGPPWRPNRSEPCRQGTESPSVLLARRS